MNLGKTFQRLDKTDLLNLLILFLCALFFWTSITCLLPTLPAYIEDIGATAKQVGYVMGCFAIGLLFSRVWLGKLADEGLTQLIKSIPLYFPLTNFFLRFSRRLMGKLVDYPSRKVVILIGTIVSTLAPLGYLWFNSLSELMLIRAFHGISLAAFTTGYSALVVDLSPKQQRGELIGYMSLAVPIGMAIGPAVGGFLQEYTNYGILFSVSTTCGMIAFICALNIKELQSCMRNKEDFSQQQKEIKPTQTLWQIIIAPSFLVPSLILLLIGCLFGTLVTFLPLYLRYIGISFNVGLFYTIAAIASFAMRFVSGQASDRYGRGIFITISIISYIFSMILLTIAHNEGTLILSALLEGIGAGILIPITLALISDRCNPTERGKVFAVCVSGFDVGVALGGPILGSLLLDLGYRYLFAITASMAIIAFLIFVAFSNKNIATSWGFAWGYIPDLYAKQELRIKN